MLALNQLDLTEGINAKINWRQVSETISFEQSGPGWRIQYVHVLRHLV
jgi:hypothetical protein